MSTNEYTRKPFVTHDGADENGVRAEVRVTTGVGKVSSIRKHDNGITAMVAFSVDGLRFDVNGWAQVEDPAFAIIEEAKESGELVEFRVENQRKAKVDRTIPIADLRVDQDTARENTVAILAGVRKTSDSAMTFTAEAVTDPAEDATEGAARTSARRPATASAQAPAASSAAPVAPALNANTLKAAVAAGLPQEVIIAQAGALLAGGVDPDVVRVALLGEDGAQAPRKEVTSRVFAKEEAAWKTHNTDGRLNLGSILVTSGVSMESFVRRELIAKEILTATNEDAPESDILVTTLAYDLMRVADYTQVQAYGKGFISNSGLSSHTRIRGIMFDIIENYLPVTAERVENSEARRDWFRTLHERTLQRFRLGILIAESTGKSIPEAAIRAALGEQAEPEQPAQPSEDAPRKEASSPADERTDAAPAAEETRYILQPTQPDTPDKPRAGEETVELFKEFASETLTPAEFAGLGALLEKTIGNRLVADNSEDRVNEFLDYYTALDTEDLRAAIAWATT